MSEWRTVKSRIYEALALLLIILLVVRVQDIVNQL
jgi:hypothetical protein